MSTAASVTSGSKRTFTRKLTNDSFGKSGYEREKDREALWNYVQTKNIAIKLGD